MRNFKDLVSRQLAALGYELRRLDSNPKTVRYENFLNLTIAFEACLNHSDNRLLPNEMRPVLLSRLLGTPPSEAYFIIQALYESMDLPGDICEFGVAQGETSALIANEIRDLTNKRLHLFDSFEGLPIPSDKDQLKDDIFRLGTIEAYAGTMSCPEEMVHSRLESVSFPSSRYVIHRGFIEELITMDRQLPTEVCFAYVDFDFYEPTKIALEFLDRVTRRGSIIIVDDYDFFSTGVKTAVGEFLDNGEGNSGTKYGCLVPDTCFGHFAVLTRKI